MFYRMTHPYFVVPNKVFNLMSHMCPLLNPYISFKTLHAHETQL